MKATLILLASIASSMAQDNKPTTTTPASATGPFYTTATLADGVVTVLKMPYSDGFYTTTVTASAVGPFYTTATLADGVVTVLEMPYSDGFYTTTEIGVYNPPSPTAAGPFYTTATLADGAVTVLEMPYSDGFYTATQSAVRTGPTPATLSTNSTKTSTSVQEFPGAAATLRAGGILQGGAAAALGAAAYWL